MNQRGCKINVKDGGEEHKMHEQSHSEVEQHIRGKQLTFEKSWGLSGSGLISGIRPPQREGRTQLLGRILLCLLKGEPRERS